jgi:hypothetical protein
MPRLTRAPTRAHQGKPARPIPFFFNLCSGWTICCPPHLKKKTEDTSPVLSKFQLLWWSENQGQYSFNLKTYFSTRLDPKHLRNHDNPLHASKNPKNSPKNRTQLETKNQPELRSVFSWTFKMQKHLI